ncbi:MAG: ABC transporter ATP-binding protein [Actinobacteria bacterium]|nr:ABC transporter ATP-binding protein [Actinomycetota bacterium]
MTEPSRTPLLEVDGLEVSYGPLQVLFGVSLHVDEGEAVALLGTNGAGKSTLLNTVSGLLHPTAGSIVFDGRDVTRLRPDQRVGLGVVQVSGGRATFPSLTVEENLRLGGYPFYADRARVSARVDEVLELFPELRMRLRQAAGTLSGGEQQMMAVGRALITDPRLLIIDELSLGLAPVVAGKILDVVDRLREQGVTMLVVEQSIHVACAITDRAYFLEKGEVRFAGPTTELLERGDLARSVFFGAAQGTGA